MKVFSYIMRVWVDMNPRDLEYGFDESMDGLAIVRQMFHSGAVPAMIDSQCLKHVPGAMSLRDRGAIDCLLRGYQMAILMELRRRYFSRQKLIDYEEILKRQVLAELPRATAYRAEFEGYKGNDKTLIPVAVAHYVELVGAENRSAIPLDKLWAGLECLKAQTQSFIAMALGDHKSSEKLKEVAERAKKRASLTGEAA